MDIRVRGLGRDEALRDEVTRQLSAALTRAGGTGGAPAATAAFNDENGPKGGRAIRCLLVVGLPPRGMLRVEHVAEGWKLAFDGALEAFERQIAERGARRRVLARRPKKYYVAKRLLEGMDLAPGAGLAPDGASRPAKSGKDSGLPRKARLVTGGRVLRGVAALLGVLAAAAVEGQGSRAPFATPGPSLGYTVEGQEVEGEVRRVDRQARTITLDNGEEYLVPWPVLADLAEVLDGVAVKLRYGVEGGRNIATYLQRLR